MISRKEHFFGLFLWVESLKEGLVNGDSIGFLRERLRGFPQDLNECFEKILFADIDKRYRRLSALMFHVALKSYTNLPLAAYWVLTQNPSVQAIKKYALEDIAPSDPIILSTLLEQMHRRLNAYSKGLLKERRMETRPIIMVEDMTTWEQDWLDYHVKFLHRTVRDFLASSNISAWLLSWNSEGPHLDAVICSASLVYLKMSPMKLKRHRKCCKSVVDSFLVNCKALHGVDSSQSNLQFIIKFIDEFLKTMWDPKTPFRNNDMFGSWAAIPDKKT